MQLKSRSVSGLLAGAALTSACELPDETFPNTITSNFRVQVQNSSYPVINNLYMNLFEAGGGDQHLFVGPVGVPTYNLNLFSGAIGRGVIRARIGGEDSEIDDTIKIFMTERGDPSALFQPEWACHPVTDVPQIELRFIGKQNDVPGGWPCVRPAFGNAHEFRYYPPNNFKNDPNRFCIKVQLVLEPVGSITVSTTSTTSTTSTSTTLSTVTTTPSTTTTPTTTPSSTSTSSGPANTNTALPYADMTSNGFRFVGCAPEERRATDGPGRVLSLALYAEDTMTNAKCVNFCGAAGYAFAGTEWTRECWCGNTVAPGRQPLTTLASLAGCNFPCGGAPSEKCGGDAWLSLYEKCPVGGPCVNAVFT